MYLWMQSVAKRLGAKKVSIVYRRRVADMTALPAEIEGAIAEGIEVQTLKAPASLDIDENHHIKGMYVTPQMISEIKGGRASVKATGEPDQYIPCDILVVAIGQNIETDHFAEAGIPVERGKIVTTAGGDFLDMPGVFAGGDCASGPATVIKAIAAAKGIDIRKADDSSSHGSAVPPSARYSTLQDLDAGRHTEIDMFSGALIRMGKELGIPTPYNEYTYHIIKALEEKNDGKFDYQKDDESVTCSR